MKLIAVITLLSIVAYASAGILVPEINYEGRIQGENGEMIDLADVDTGAGLSTKTELPPIRHRRLTCDLLSFGTKKGSLSKVACPVSCLAQGRPGGSCKNGVCVCK